MKRNSLIFIFLIYFFSLNISSADEFKDWLSSFKIIALKNGVTENTFDIAMKNVKYLPKVIEYDRYQPEFYEDTKTYISKRSSKDKVSQGKVIYKKNRSLIDKVEKEFNVDRELLLALMGIETNFGKYLGKMDILSSLATLSFDKRRSEFFTKELIQILQLIESGVIDKNLLYGSWAGAFGNFQFMPTTINNYAIDYNLDGEIDLKSINDSFASAANYINKLGWNKNEPCYLKIDLIKDTPINLLNTSAKEIKNKKTLKKIKKYIKNSDNIKFNEKLMVGIITPDKDIVENSKLLEPAFIVFNNYELILKWNRSLRFGLAVCNLKNRFKNEL
tara:strand:- start:5249 stop:6244 length:996 start_codon:yes stop_codon:yes gene_type:complete